MKIRGALILGIPLLLEHMYKKIRSRLLAAISASQEKKEYVLESVFWVPKPKE